MTPQDESATASSVEPLFSSPASIRWRGACATTLSCSFATAMWPASSPRRNSPSWIRPRRSLSFINCPKARTLAPGFIDVQVNGGSGVMFNDEPNVQGVAAIVSGPSRARHHGPAAHADHRQPRCHGDGARRQARDRRACRGVLGLHFEGPFDQPGAQGRPSRRLLLSPTMRPSTCCLASRHRALDGDGRSRTHAARLHCRSRRAGIASGRGIPRRPRRISSAPRARASPASRTCSTPCRRCRAARRAGRLGDGGSTACFPESSWMAACRPGSAFAPGVPRDRAQERLTIGWTRRAPASSVGQAFPKSRGHDD